MEKCTLGKTYDGYSHNEPAHLKALSINWCNFSSADLVSVPSHQAHANTEIRSKPEQESVFKK
jgi:hypothetical protein